MYTYIYVYACVYIYVYIDMYIYVYIYIYLYIHTCITLRHITSHHITYIYIYTYLLYACVYVSSLPTLACDCAGKQTRCRVKKCQPHPSRCTVR